MTSQCDRAMTLLEVVLAMTLLVVLSSMTYWFYSSSMDTSRRGHVEADKLRLARIVLERISTEIRQSSVLTDEERMGVRGDKERLSISTLRVPTKETTRKRSSREGPPPAELDIVKVEYKIARHPEILHPDDGYEYPLGLARVETLIPRAIPTSLASKRLEGTGDEGTAEEPEEPLPPDPFFEEEEEGNRSLELDIDWEELYAPEIRYLRFCYHDGSKWWDDWQVPGENPLPQLVMVTIGFDPHPPCGEEFGQDDTNEEFCECLNKDPVDCLPLTPDQFSTVVRVRGADPVFRSRVGREGQAFVDEILSGGDEEQSNDNTEEP